MTKKKISYEDMTEYRDNPERGFRSLNQDLINGRLVVTWVNGTDDPANTPTPTRRMTRTQFVDELAEREQVRLS